MPILSVSVTLFYCYRIKRFSSSLVCFVFAFCRVLTFLRYIGVYYTFGLLDCFRYNTDFVISRFVMSRFCSIHFTVPLAGLENIVRYTEDFVM